jgi:hypothetical protein
MNHQEFEKIASQLSDLTNYPKGYVPDINKQYYRTKRLQQEIQSKHQNSRWLWIAASIFFIAASLMLLEFYSSTPINKISPSNKQRINSPAITNISGSKHHVVDNTIIKGMSSTGVEYPLSDTSSKTVVKDSVYEPNVISVLTVMKSIDTLAEKLSPKWVSQLKKQRKYNIISIAPEAYNPQPKLHNRNFDFFVLGDRGFELIKRLPQKEETILYPNRDN